MFHVLIKLTKQLYTRGLFPDKASERSTMESKINTRTLANRAHKASTCRSRCAGLRAPGLGAPTLLKIKWWRRSSINGREASALDSSHAARSLCLQIITNSTLSCHYCIRLPELIKVKLLFILSEASLLISYSYITWFTCAHSYTLKINQTYSKFSQFH